VRTQITSAVHFSYLSKQISAFEFNSINFIENFVDPWENVDPWEEVDPWENVDPWEDLDPWENVDPWENNFFFGWNLLGVVEFFKVFSV
jgi:hypothetical protein